ncbi:MAG: NYN domain-containing protein [Robiginitomaculum sp.]|nr:NYN domain-containing protein [Robiginitomaculum sp.]MDQ7078246.1 NYN domain-containing protein [Robiginitomaculum sp.]
MAFYPDERLGLFIDGANFYAALRALDIEIDYSRLLDEFRRRGRLVRANYYTALVDDQEFSPLKKMVDWLDYNGFTIITKSAKEYTDISSGRKRIKGDMDVDITVDALSAADWLDHIILFSGDGDFCPLVKAIQRKGVRVSVVSTTLSNPPVASDDLRRVADSFIELSDLAPLLGRPLPDDNEAGAL